MRVDLNMDGYDDILALDYLKGEVIYFESTQAESGEVQFIDRRTPCILQDAFDMAVVRNPYTLHTDDTVSYEIVLVSETILAVCYISDCMSNSILDNGKMATIVEFDEGSTVEFVTGTDTWTATNKDEIRRSSSIIVGVSTPIDEVDGEGTVIGTTNQLYVTRFDATDVLNCIRDAPFYATTEDLFSLSDIMKVYSYVCDVDGDAIDDLVVITSVESSDTLSFYLSTRDAALFQVVNPVDRTSPDDAIYFSGQFRRDQTCQIFALHPAGADTNITIVSLPAASASDNSSTPDFFTTSTLVAENQHYDRISGVIATDYDNSGDIDLFIEQLHVYNTTLLLNFPDTDGTWHFEQMHGLSDVNKAVSTASTYAWDTQSSGYPDLVTISNSISVFRNTFFLQSVSLDTLPGAGWDVSIEGSCPTGNLFIPLENEVASSPYIVHYCNSTHSGRLFVPDSDVETPGYNDPISFSVRESVVMMRAIRLLDSPNSQLLEVAIEPIEIDDGSGHRFNMSLSIRQIEGTTVHDPLLVFHLPTYSQFSGSSFHGRDSEVALIVSDVNGDGIDDVFMTTPETNILVLIGGRDPNPHLMESQSLTSIGYPAITNTLPRKSFLSSLYSIVDLNNDRSLDIVFITDSLDIYIYYGDGEATSMFEAEAQVLYESPETVIAIQTADINEDGAVDVIYQGGSDGIIGRIMVLYNDKNNLGTFLYPVAIYQSKIILQFVVLDLNADGVLDLCFSELSTDSLVSTYMLWGSRSGFSKPELLHTLAESDELDLIPLDLAGDRSVDLLVASNDGFVLRRNGTCC